MARASTSALREVPSAPSPSVRWRPVGCACPCPKQSTTSQLQELQTQPCPPGPPLRHERSSSRAKASSSSVQPESQDSLRFKWQSVLVRGASSLPAAILG